MNIDPRGIPQGQYYQHMPPTGNIPPGNMMRAPPPGVLQPGFAGSKPSAKTKQSPPGPTTPRMQQAMRRPHPQEISAAQFSRAPMNAQQRQAQQAAQQQQQMWSQAELARQRPPPMAPQPLPMSSDIYRAKMTGRAQIILDINTELLRQALTNPKQSQIYVECMKRVQTNIAHLYTLNDQRASPIMMVPPPILTAPPGIPSLQSMYASLEATFQS